MTEHLDGNTYPIEPFTDDLLLPPNIQTIQVTKDISIKYDADDGWFGLMDKEAGAYDELGAVLMTFDDLDALIVALGQLRDRVK